MGFSESCHLFNTEHFVHLLLHIALHTKSVTGCHVKLYARSKENLGYLDCNNTGNIVLHLS